MSLLPEQRYDSPLAMAEDVERWLADEPVLVLPEERFVPAEELVPELEHVRKWPPEHWHLAFQGQLRTINEADAELLRERLTRAAGNAAAEPTAAGA